jgi:hypothetical protein
VKANLLRQLLHGAVNREDGRLVRLLNWWLLLLHIAPQRASDPEFPLPVSSIADKIHPATVDRNWRSEYGGPDSSRLNSSWLIQKSFSFIPAMSIAALPCFRFTESAVSVP